MASKYANEYILSLDGDLIVHPDDMKQILQCETEFVGGGTIETEEPWMVQSQEIDGNIFATGFSRESGSYEWNGITQIRREKIQDGRGHVYQLLIPSLPLPYRNRYDNRLYECSEMGKERILLSVRRVNNVVFILYYANLKGGFNAKEGRKIHSWRSINDRNIGAWLRLNKSIAIS